MAYGRPFTPHVSDDQGARTDGFSQGGCSIAPGAADGNLKRGAGYWPCRVVVGGGNVALLMQLGNRTIDMAPAESVRITAPRWLRRLGTGTTLSMNGRLWVIDFTRVYQLEHGPGGWPQLVKGPRHARTMTRDFTAALLSAGGVDLG
jgi:hypothetical protein